MCYGRLQGGGAINFVLLLNLIPVLSVLRETGLHEALLIQLPDDLDKAWAVWLVLPVPSPAPGKGSSCGV